MKSKLIVVLIALTFALGCANWANLSPTQKATLACDTSIAFVKPECARLDDDAAKCVAVLDAAQVACNAAIKKDVAGVCPAIQAASSKCAEIEDVQNRGTCERVVAAASAACVLATAKPAAPAE